MLPNSPARKRPVAKPRLPKKGSYEWHQQQCPKLKSRASEKELAGRRKWTLGHNKRRWSSHYRSRSRRGNCATEENPGRAPQGSSWSLLPTDRTLLLEVEMTGHGRVPMTKQGTPSQGPHGTERGDLEGAEGGPPRRGSGTRNGTG